MCYRLIKTLIVTTATIKSVITKYKEYKLKSECTKRYIPIFLFLLDNQRKLKYNYVKTAILKGGKENVSDKFARKDMRSN
jgi:hypothetical protein